MNLVIRDASERDFDLIQRIYSYYVIKGTFTFEVAPPDVLSMIERWKVVKDRGHPYLVAENQYNVIGYAYASNFRKRMGFEYTLENSVYVAQDSLNKGVGGRLLGELIKQCENLGIRQMVAVIGGSDNHYSFKLHTKFGFQRVGLLPSTGFKNGKWIDTVLMQRQLGDGEKTLPG